MNRMHSRLTHHALIRADDLDKTPAAYAAQGGDR
jgi:hypothetical protein